MCGLKEALRVQRCFTCEGLDEGSSGSKISQLLRWFRAAEASNGTSDTILDVSASKEKVSVFNAD